MKLSLFEKEELITEMFEQLQDGADWLKQHPEDEDLVLLSKRAERLIAALKELGVEEEFSWSVMVFGPRINKNLVGQFLKE